MNLNQKKEKNLKTNILNKQQRHWEHKFSKRSEMFGTSPSLAAQKAVKIFKREKFTNILELGAGQGRDTIFFAQNGFNLQVLDYSKSGLNSIIKKAKTMNLSDLISVKYHDIRKSIPFKDATFDCCFSHMLYCMAFTEKELEFLSNNINRVLKFGGLNIYTVRHIDDADYGKGIHRGEDIYETGGFIVHFFSLKKINQFSTGYNVINIENFEEGDFPRKLFQITLKKISK